MISFTGQWVDRNCKKMNLILENFGTNANASDDGTFGKYRRVLTARPQMLAIEAATLRQSECLPRDRYRGDPGRSVVGGDMKRQSTRP